MKKYILNEHLVAWCKWKNVNVAFDSENLHKESPNIFFVIGYGAIINHFVNGNPYKKYMHNNKKLWKTYYCLLLKLTCLILL
jgi:hypothetical protein